MNLKTKLPVLAAALSALSPLVSGAMMVDRPAHLVAVLTLFASAFGAGVGVASAKAQSRKQPDADPPSAIAPLLPLEGEKGQ